MKTDVVQETEFRPLSGALPVILIWVVLIAGGILSFIAGAATRTGFLGIGGALSVLVGLFLSTGALVLAPNQACALLLFGTYVGSVKRSGFFYVNPFYSKKKVSLRIRNFETGSTESPETKDASGKRIPGTRSTGSPSKVNDRDGNPIDISAVVVWRVANTAEALFEVDDFKDYVSVQSESALRTLASRHPYDSADHEVSLRGNTEAVSAALRDDIQERLGKAGVDVVEARISHLAYAPEIAAAMLQRQQAQAVVAARTLIVDGAVGMVEMALERLTRDGIVPLDDERRAAMVSNLLVVLCSGGHTQPVVNAGTLYQ
jgi:regulator of protease activity HflC (stomatin/prohibitin superfamily)